METNKMNKMMKKIEDLMTATSFAEEGEFDSAQLFLRGERRVLLAVREGHIDAKTLKYALNTTKRINAHLDILFVSSDGNEDQNAATALARFQADLKAEGVQYRLIQRTGCLKQEIVDYTNTEKEILFAVVESPGSLDAECKKKDTRLSELWQNLKCPLVVVMDEARA
jgi:hypothetical protein